MVVAAASRCWPASSRASGCGSDAEALGIRAQPGIRRQADHGARRAASRSTIAQGLTFTVVGPMQPELEALQKKHDEWLKELKKKGKTPPQALAAYVDKSVPNLSSIVVLAEAGGKTHAADRRRARRQDPGGPGARRRCSKTGGTACTSTCSRCRTTAAPTTSTTTSSSASPPTTTCSPATASTAIRSARSLEMLFEARGERRLHDPPDLSDRRDRQERKEDWEKSATKRKEPTEKSPGRPVRPDCVYGSAQFARLFRRDAGVSRTRCGSSTTSKPHLIDLLGSGRVLTGRPVEASGAIAIMLAGKQERGVFVPRREWAGDDMKTNASTAWNCGSPTQNSGSRSFNFFTAFSAFAVGGIFTAPEKEVDAGILLITGMFVVAVAKVFSLMGVRRSRRLVSLQVGAKIGAHVLSPQLRAFGGSHRVRHVAELSFKTRATLFAAADILRGKTDASEYHFRHAVPEALLGRVRARAGTHHPRTAERRPKWIRSGANDWILQWGKRLLLRGSITQTPSSSIQS